MNFHKPKLRSIFAMPRISLVVFIAVFLFGVTILQYSTAKALYAGTIDIAVSDVPDPFYPSSESNSIVVISNGNNCRLTLSIENTGRSWEWENLDAGGSVQVVWDGKDVDGNFVSTGTYNYTAFCVQNRNNPIGLSTFNISAKTPCACAQG